MSYKVRLSASVFFFKQKTAYEMRISDWSSDVCSSDLRVLHQQLPARIAQPTLGHTDGNDTAVDGPEHRIGVQGPGQERFVADQHREQHPTAARVRFGTSPVGQ